MLADRTLLGVTLAASFVAGGTAGWAARGREADIVYRPTDARSVYSQELRTLRDRGYDETEMNEAVRQCQAYLDAYHAKWDEFCGVYDKSLLVLDDHHRTEMADLEMRFRQRRAAK